MIRVEFTREELEAMLRANKITIQQLRVDRDYHINEAARAEQQVLALECHSAALQRVLETETADA